MGRVSEPSFQSWGCLDWAHGKIALSGLSASQSFANFVRDFMFAAAWNGCVPNGFFLELDRHVCFVTS